MNGLKINIFFKFKTWTEAQGGLGAVNFITGVGGFLQAIFFGYAGLRLNVESLTIDGDLPLPPNTTYLFLHRIKYLDTSLSLNYTANQIQLKVSCVNQKLPLEILTQKGIYRLTENTIINLPKAKYIYKIYTSISSNCPLPYDNIDRSMC